MHIICCYICPVFLHFISMLVLVPVANMSGIHCIAINLHQLKFFTDWPSGEFLWFDFCAWAVWCLQYIFAVVVVCIEWMGLCCINKLCGEVIDLPHSWACGQWLYCFSILTAGESMRVLFRTCPKQLAFKSCWEISFYLLICACPTSKLVCGPVEQVLKWLQSWNGENACHVE